MDAKVFFNVDAKLGEGCLWDEKTQTLWYVDIEGKQLGKVRDNEVTRYDMPSRIGTVGLTDSNDLIVALEDGLYFFDPETKALTLFTSPDSTPGNRGNDGKPAPNGDFFADVMPMVKEQHGGLYQVKPDGSFTCIMGSLDCANGLGWSPDHKTMYFIDSPSKVVFGFDYDEATGNVSNRRVVVDLTGDPQEYGVPDGMCVDGEGKLWVARCGGGMVQRFDNVTGLEIDRVVVPCPLTTCATFGGKDMDTLFITTMGFAKEKFPDSGCIFCCKPGVKGMEAFRFHKA